MRTTRKVTVQLSSDLLKKAQKSTGSGITETIRKGLELLAAAKVYEKLASMKGKIRFGVSAEVLREDRR